MATSRRIVLTQRQGGGLRGDFDHRGWMRAVLAWLVLLSVQAHARSDGCILPRILIYADASGSMNAYMPMEKTAGPRPKGSASPPKRWEVLQEAVESLARKADQTQADLEFRLFKSEGNTCELKTDVLPLARAQTFTQKPLPKEKHWKPVGQFTPLAAAIREGVEVLRKPGSSCAKKILVLVTDGIPHCPAGKKGELEQTKAELRKASLADVKVVIIGAGNPKDLEMLASEVCTVLETVEALSLDQLKACAYVKASNAAQLFDAFLAATCLATRDTCDGCDNDCDGLTDEDCPKRDSFTESLDSIADVTAVGTASGWHCTGVLVSPQHVLTARHCLPATRVLFGLDTASPEEILAIKQSIPHPDSQRDAALLVLSGRTERPYRRRRSIDESQPPLGVVRHAGFGARDSAGREGFGRKHFMDVWAHGWNCDAAERQRLGCHPEFEFVLPAGAGRDTCVGDSGGPVFERIDVAPMCPTNLTHASRPTFRLLGITSRPVANARQRCGDGGVYVRLDQLAGWLEPLLPRSQENP
jgi:hypothetical protein